MAITYSPLRYPGGKTSLYPLVKSIIDTNNLNNSTYIEPFAGGSGLALKLLLNGVISELIINDIDASIFSFWNCVINRTDQLCDKILRTPVTIGEWNIQRKIWLEHGNGNIFDFGFATLFLNRTNVSGILKGGIIGGYEQTGKYKINARFNKQELIRKIQLIAEKRDNILIYNVDAIDFIIDILPNFPDSFVNFDPPYVMKGSRLYVNYYNPENHNVLSNLINGYYGDWMMTYDDCSLIRDLYRERRRFLLPINYSAGVTKATKEIVIFSDSIEIPLDFQEEVI